jgi:hypothetical protein
MAHCNCVYQCLLLNLFFLLFITREDVFNAFRVVKGSLTFDAFPLESGFLDTNLWWNQWITSPSVANSRTTPVEYSGTCTRLLLVT